MKFQYIVYFLLVVVCLSSCVPLKRITYLQENEQQQDSLLPVRKAQEAYRLQINDLLSVRVKALDDELASIFNPIGESNPNASSEESLYYEGFKVDPRGNIRVPLLGEMPVLGLTLNEVRKAIEERLLKDYFKKEANLFVTVKLVGIRYTINGEIRRPGSNIIYRDQATIMEAIGNSGDIPVTGDKTDVIIIRQYPLGQKVHHIDLTTIDAMNSPFYFIQPNDQIIVNPLPQKTLGTGTTGLQSFTTILSVVTALTTTILLFIRL
ncbi:MAG: polysaccharide biosynthesis/export family protein [Flavobacteriaceae bacterium]|nr:polysaccharide biosynthesis/export family protein [Flavobacteriaceae bacterium]